MIHIEITEQTGRLLADYAARTGQDFGRIADSVIADYLQWQAEENELVAERIRRIETGEEALIPAEEVWAKLGLED